MRVCAEPGCPRLATDTRCEEHRKAKRRREDKRRPSSRQRGYDAQWERTRDEYRRRYPHCEEPGCHEAATDVHHLDGLGPLGPRGHDWSNLVSLCHAHHSRITATEQPGGFHV